MAGVTSAGILERNRDYLSRTPMLYSRVGDSTLRLGSAADFHQAYADADRESALRGIPSGGVRPPDVIRKLPINETPDALGALFSALGTAALGITGVTNMDWSFDLLDAGADLIEVEDAVSVLDAVDAGNGFADWSAIESGIAVSEGAGAAPSWYGGLLDFGADLGKKAVEQFVKQEIQEEFTGPASVRTNPVPVYRSLPQQNSAPSGGLMSFLYPRSSGGSASTGSAYVGGGFGSSLSGPRSGESGGFSLPLPLMALGAVVLLIAIVLLRR